MICSVVQYEQEENEIQKVAKRDSGIVLVLKCSHQNVPIIPGM